MLPQPLLAEDWAGSRLWQAGSGDQRVVHQYRIGWSGDFGIPGLVVLVPSDSDDITNKNCPRLILHAMDVKAFISREVIKD